MNMRFLVLTIVFFLSIEAFASDSLKLKKEKKVNTAGLLLPSRAPEYGWYVQGGAIGLFKTEKDSVLRVSNLYLFLLASEYKQWRLSIGGDVFTPKEKYYINFWYYRSHLPDLYYGIGSLANPDSGEFVTYNIWYFNTNVFRKIKPYTFAGIGQLFENVSGIDAPEEGFYETHPPTGSAGYTVSGIGPKFRRDTRDNLLSSRKGFFAEASWLACQKWLGSSYNYRWWYLDVRKFFTVSARHRHYFAMQGYYSQVNGEVPFRQLPSINTRAYHPNLYRDRIAGWYQAEYRLAIWRWVGASFFTGVAISGNDFSDAIQNSWKPNVGGGLRFLLVKAHNMHMRVEYGIGKNSSNFYLSFYDAF